MSEFPKPPGVFHTLGLRGKEQGSRNWEMGRNLTGGKEGLSQSALGLKSYTEGGVLERGSGIYLSG